jgi:hypothetical protein
MTLKGDWQPEHVERLNIIAREIWAKWHYDIEMDAFETEDVPYERTASFDANGRWVFRSSLMHLGESMSEAIEDKPELEAIYRELLASMRDSSLTIEVSYSDEEGGCRELYRQTGALSSDGSTLSYSVLSQEDFEYNWENYIDVTGDADAFYMLVESLCGQIGAEEDEDGSIERWAKARTYPHCEEFGMLNEDAQAEFGELFLTAGVRSE